MRETLAGIFMSRPRDHWVDLLQDTDACFAPVLSPAEAPDHPQNRARGIFSDGPVQPMPAPRFARSDTPLPSTPPAPGADSREVLDSLGLSAAEIETLFKAGAVS
jgi:alpha-methylacyl-CoA racemase